MSLSFLCLFAPFLRVSRETLSTFLYTVYFFVQLGCVVILSTFLYSWSGFSALSGGLCFDKRAIFFLGRVVP